MSEENTNFEAAPSTEPSQLENNAYDSTELYTEPDTTEVVEDTSSDDTKESEEPGQKPEGEGQDTTQTSVEENQELAKKLREYELHKEEQDLLRRRLGLSNEISDEELGMASIEQRVINQGQLAYLDLCNKYGVNADLNRIDQTIAELKQTDPAKGYEFERQLERVADRVNGQRQEIANTRFSSGVQQFERDNAEIISASPVVQNTLAQVVQANAGDPQIYNILNNTMSYIQALYSEAFAYGKQFALLDNAKKDTSRVEGGIVNGTNQITPSGGNLYTRQQIDRMSQSEFEKNYEAIMRAYADGRIVD